MYIKEIIRKASISISDALEWGEAGQKSVENALLSVKDYPYKEKPSVLSITKQSHFTKIPDQTLTIQYIGTTDSSVRYCWSFHLKYSLDNPNSSEEDSITGTLKIAEDGKAKLRIETTYEEVI